MAKMLRVLALTTPREGYDQIPCVPDPHGADATPQRRRTVGMKHQEVEPGQWGWVPSGEPEDIAHHYDIIKALKDGDLLPADEDTAAAAGVKFEAPVTLKGAGEDEGKTAGGLKSALRSLVGTKPDESGNKDGE